MTSYDQIFDKAIDRLHEEGRYRVFIDILRNKGAYPNARCFHGHNGPKPITVWCSNDYLAMGQHPKVTEAMEQALHDVGAGSGGTRNIGGNTHYHIELEAELADLHGKEAALIFTSGYVSNDATLSTLAKLLPGCVIFSDALNHASIIDGVRLCKAKRFRYANNDTLAAIKAIGEALEEHPPAQFFAQLDMRDTVAETDWRGDYILSSQVWSTARDLAKLGQLYLDDGVLPSGERVLPEGWAEYVSSPSGPQPDGAFGYGAGFWLLNDTPGVPADAFAAMGNRGQHIVIVPSLDLVIVRRGEDPAGQRFDIAGFARDVIASLEE